MPGPFYGAIKGTTAGAAGTGAFTPNAASANYLAWSTVPAGWTGKVRFDDTGSAYSEEHCYWNGTTLSRAATQVYIRPDGTLRTSTGAHLSLTAAATATMVADSLTVGPSLGLGQTRGYLGIPAVTTSPTAIGRAGATVSGTAIAASLLTTNALTELPRSQQDSLLTANAQCGLSGGVCAVYSTTAGRGGFLFEFTGGAAALPTSPRIFWGLASTTFVGQTIEPSAFVAHVAVFALDSTDTTIQLLTNSNVGGGTKINTGIALVAGGVYRASIWADPGGGRIYGLLVRLDTGAIWMGSTTVDIPTTTTLRDHAIGGLSAASTVFSMCEASMFCRPVI